MSNFKGAGINFEAVVSDIVRQYLAWLKEQGFEFKEELQTVFASYFALLELRRATEKLVKDYEKLPVFKGLDPERAYRRWLDSKRERKIVEFKPKEEEKDDSGST